MTRAVWATKKAAGGVLTAKQAPHRPGTAPALGLRAGEARRNHSRADRLRKGGLNHVVNRFALLPEIGFPAQPVQGGPTPEPAAAPVLRATAGGPGVPGPAQHLHGPGPDR